MSAPEIVAGTYVRKTEGAGFEGEVRAVYTSRKGTAMAVVEIIGGPFAGMQHIYRLSQLRKAEPSEWFQRERAGGLEGK